MNDHATNQRLAREILTEARASLEAALRTIADTLGALEAADAIDPVTDAEAKAAGLARDAARRADAAAVDALDAALGGEGIVPREQACPVCGNRREDEFAWEDEIVMVCCVCGHAYAP